MAATARPTALDDDDPAGATLADVVEALAEIADEIRALRSDLASRPAAPAADTRHAKLLEAIEEGMSGLDLSFSAAEVLEHARVDHGLGEALTACSVDSVAALGALFRSLKDRDLGGRRLARYGRAWRLAAHAAHTCSTSLDLDS